MGERGVLSIMCPNKYSRRSSSSSASSIKEKKLFAKLKVGLSGDYPRKNGEFLSGQYGTNLLLIGVALMLAITHHEPSVEEEHLLAFATGLMVLQLCWMMWYILVRTRRRSARTERDVNATTCWIRGNKERAHGGEKKRNTCAKNHRVCLQVLYKKSMLVTERRRRAMVFFAWCMFLLTKQRMNH